MIKNSLYIVTFFSLFFLLGCSKMLDVVPKGDISDDLVWSSEENADLFLNDVYSRIGGFDTFDPIENYTDNAINSVAGRYSQVTFALGNYTPSTAPNLWGNYNGVRAANVFLENIKDSELPDEYKRKRSAEARFLRAYFYSILLTHYGGVPIIKIPLNRSAQGDDIFYPRSSFTDTFDFIVGELEDIFEDLDIKPETGRASKGAALTLKGWVELFAASPLNNKDNDLDKWSVAADTYKRVIDLQAYSLFSDHWTLFLEENNNNQEVIFDKSYFKNNSIVSNVGPSWVDDEKRGTATSVPTQELVDSYAMSNGLPIGDSNSGYDPQDPYVNREKRFYDDIIYDGSEWCGAEMIMKQGVGSKNATNLNHAMNSTVTGYYWRKRMDPKYAFFGDFSNSAHYIIFRYAEVLLGFAEAENEVNGPTEDVYAAVNEVRERVELPPLENLNQSEMRKAIHRERRVELAFEDKRWLDLTRLKIANDKLNGSLHAVVIEKKNGDWVYNYVPAAGGQRGFHDPRNYWYPIPQGAIDRNPLLEPN